jgi:quinolinate synthase
MLTQIKLPEPFFSMSNEECTNFIKQKKQEIGKKLVVLTHHYQRPEVVQLGDIRGDSLKLAQYAAAQSEAEYILYCGVHFMAESADILKLGNQKVILPDLGAGCDMADMADADDVEEAWNSLVSVLGHESIMPVTYINSTAALKAFVGKKGGIVCTSTNAEKIIRQSLAQKKTIFFFPDQHLGRNTCKKIGISLSEMVLWNYKKNYLGGNSPEALRNAKVFLWEGLCPVHAMFTLKQVEKIKNADAEFKIISHPECTMDVVDASDFVGSTEFIVKTIAESLPGTKWAVGTEMNLVNRIAQENKDKTIVSINPYMCLCGTMNRIDLKHFAWALNTIACGEPQNIIRVEGVDRAFARASLDRMLSLS